MSIYTVNMQKLNSSCDARLQRMAQNCAFSARYEYLKTIKTRTVIT